MRATVERYSAWVDAHASVAVVRHNSGTHR
jgi:hypothetical protein